MCLADRIRNILECLRHLLIIDLEVAISEVVLRARIIYKVDDIIENFFNLLFKGIDEHLGVVEDCRNFLVLRKVCEGSPAHFH
jgi:hypothetical protein